MKEETKIKISNALKGRKAWNKGTKGMMRAWNKGVKQTEETKQKISSSLKGKTPWNKGKKWNDEIKAKISLAKKNWYKEHTH